MAFEANDGSDNIVNLTHNRRSYYSHEEFDSFENYIWQRSRVLFYFISIGCPIAIFCGVFTNILAFVVLVRSRQWLKHEGYVYLAAIFCVNVGVLMFCTSAFWHTSAFGRGYYYPPDISNVMCKVWHFLMSIFFAYGWLCVAFLFNVCLREDLVQRRRCGCPMFAAKYCTLFASKTIVGVIFSVLFICGIPYLVIFEITPGGRCSESTPYLALLAESILMWVLPFLLFLPTILTITLCTKREGNTFGFSQIDERSVSDEQMRVLAVTLSSMTLFSQIVCIPLHYFIMMHMQVGSRVVVELVYSLSLGLQPILCFVILKALRDGFRFQLRNILCCRRLFPSLDREEEVVQLSAIQEDPLRTTES